MREEQLFDLVDCLYQAAFDPKMWVNFVEKLEAALGGAAAVLCLPCPTLDHPGKFVAPSLKPAFLKVYEESCIDIDPCFPHLGELAVGSFEFGDSLVADTEFGRSAFYREWMAPQDFLRGPSFAGVIDRDWEQGTTAIRVFRPRGTSRYGRAEQSLGQLLMAPLRHAAQIHFKMAKHEAERRALVSVFDRIPSALILVDSRSRVCTTNRAADRLLAQRDGLIVKREGLRAANPAETETLQQLLAEAARTDAGRALPTAGPLLLQRPSGLPPLHALVTPIRAGTGWLGLECPVAAIFVSDPEEVTEIPAEVLRCFYGLTPAEAALGCAIARGGSLSEAAEQLGIRRETARSRLKDIFGKTGTSRQAALVRLLLSIPGQAGGEE